jgi:hypothetical protein
MCGGFELSSTDSAITTRGQAPMPGGTRRSSPLQSDPSFRNSRHLPQLLFSPILGRVNCISSFKHRQCFSYCLLGAQPNHEGPQIDPSVPGAASLNPNVWLCPFFFPRHSDPTGARQGRLCHAMLFTPLWVLKVSYSIELVGWWLINRGRLRRAAQPQWALCPLMNTHPERPAAWSTRIFVSFRFPPSHVVLAPVGLVWVE